MNEPDNPHALLLEILQNAVPPGVAEELPLDAPAFLMDDFFPAPVVNDILNNWNQPPPPPNLRKDMFLSYQDSGVEQQFLRWEAGNSRLQLGFCSFFLFCCFVTHLSLCSQQSMEGGDWKCGNQVSLILATMLIWIPLMALFLPRPYDWQLKEIICVVHQCLFGIMVSTFALSMLQESAKNSSCTTLEPNFLLYCTVPVLMESVLFRVRLKYHIPLNVLLISVISFPWLRYEEDLTAMTIRRDYGTSAVAALLVPVCLITIYQRRVRQSFERTL